jgi:hypothetical protein
LSQREDSRGHFGLSPRPEPLVRFPPTHTLFEDRPHWRFHRGLLIPSGVWSRGTAQHGWPPLSGQRPKGLARRGSASSGLSLRHSRGSRGGGHLRSRVMAARVKKKHACRAFAFSHFSTLPSGLFSARAWLGGVCQNGFVCQPLLFTSRSETCNNSRQEHHKGRREGLCAPKICSCLWPFCLSTGSASPFLGGCSVVA